MEPYDLSVHTPVDVDVADDVDDAIPVMGSDANEEVLLSKYYSVLCVFALLCKTMIMSMLQVCAH